MYFQALQKTMILQVYFEIHLSRLRVTTMRWQLSTTSYQNLLEGGFLIDINLLANRLRAYFVGSVFCEAGIADVLVCLF